MATGSLIRRKPTTPRRKCLDCGYPIFISSPPRCPECGRWYNPADATTTGSIEPQDSTTDYTPGALPAIIAVPVAFVSLFSTQYVFMGWWHDTTIWTWWRRISSPGSWWELTDIGHWLWTTQMILFSLWSVLFGVFISRLTIHRYRRHARR